MGCLSFNEGIRNLMEAPRFLSHVLSVCSTSASHSFIHLSQGCSVWESRKQEKNSPSCSIVPSAPESCNSTAHNPSLRSHVSHFTSRWLHAPEATRCVLQSSSQFPSRPQERHIAREICLTSQVFLLDGNECTWRRKAPAEIPRGPGNLTRLV